MANIKANIKSKRQSDKRHFFNKAKISTLKTSIKKAKETRDKQDLAIVYAHADSLSRKGIIHKNRANRIKARLAKFLNKNKENEIKQESTKKVIKKDNNKDKLVNNATIDTSKDNENDVVKK